MVTMCFSVFLLSVCGKTRELRNVDAINRNRTKTCGPIIVAQV
jgi:hypothetical protein